jgi:hypothetical protein
MTEEQAYARFDSLCFRQPRQPAGPKAGNHKPVGYCLIFFQTKLPDPTENYLPLICRSLEESYKERET